ncbi:zinc ribbon domain-containing protein [Polyangium mundeleinium]|uniref:Zinc ribbon domain-containing protein n=1 Tax=Polyangium mundeleinium TaxID=2995306 RepID=A0ABT5EFB6_9BACT|nr:zinc ribbon domain-containing protein [Polyangium mundeleinium]MDC0740466.1 zinc ribbon domain-containing protein [Polyangium mundeleinium]
MVSTVHCPNCGAPAQAGSATCSYCRAVLAWPGAPAGAAQASGPSGMPAGVVEALRAGNKFEAIRLYREARKSSLLDAKNAVDALEKQLGLG